ncbi:MAG TPA: HdeD family acid-resistance protein [Solirubrobacterales bacterium]|nr:HdeD family acid-resistance protein [Solirubrobacterales bacterium]
MESSGSEVKDSRGSGFLVGFGIVLMLLGAFAILVPALASWGITVLIGWILVVASVFVFAWAFSAPGALHVIIRAFWALLTLVAGVFLLVNPDKGMKALTLLLIIYFLVMGFSRLMVAFTRRGLPGAGWLAVNGLLGIIIGAIFWIDYPTSADWAIGLLVGIDLIFTGWTLILFSKDLGQLSDSLDDGLR